MKAMTKSVQKIIVLSIFVFGIGVLSNAQSKVPVKASNLQKGITEYIAKNYAGYTIGKAFKTDRNKLITYEVNLKKENKAVRLAFDQSGTFLKVIEPKAKSSKIGAISNKANQNSNITANISSTKKPQK
jgi:hypothetical protein